MVHRLYPDFVAWQNQRVIVPNQENQLDHYSFTLDEYEHIEFSNGLVMNETGVCTSDQRYLIVWDWKNYDHYAGLWHLLVDIPTYHDLIRLFYIPFVIGG